MPDITVTDPRWQALAFDELASTAVTRVLVWAELDPDGCEVSILACDDMRIAELNDAFRGQNKPTNVLSWPAEDLAAGQDGGHPAPPKADFTGEVVLGDIAIAFETCNREAQDAAKPLAAHVTHLIVHGMLHLLGYDHERDRDATLMERIEVEILGSMGVSDPYTVV